MKRGNQLYQNINSESTLELRQEYAKHFISYAPKDQRNCIFIGKSTFISHLVRKANSDDNWKELVTTKGKSVDLIVAANKERIVHFKIIENPYDLNVLKDFLNELLAKMSSNWTFNSSWILLEDRKLNKHESIEKLISEFDYSLKYLSPYSHMLNPVEDVFLKLKNYIRSITVTNLEHKLPQLLNEGIDTISANELFNIFENMMKNIALAILRHKFN